MLCVNHTQINKQNAQKGIKKKSKVTRQFSLFAIKIPTIGYRRSLSSLVDLVTIDESSLHYLPALPVCSSPLVKVPTEPALLQPTPLIYIHQRSPQHPKAWPLFILSRLPLIDTKTARRSLLRRLACGCRTSMGLDVSPTTAPLYNGHGCYRGSRGCNA